MSDGPSRRVLHVRSSGMVLGAERVAMMLCTGASQFGYEAQLAVTHDRAEPVPDLVAATRRLGVDVSILSCRHAFDPNAILQLRKLVVSHGVDVVHCHGYRENLYAVMGRLGVRTVTTNHLWKRTTTALRIYAKVDTIVSRRFDRVVAVSREVQAELQRLGFDSPQLRYVPNGIDTKTFAPSVETDDALAARRRDHGLADADLVLIAVGSLTVEKGHRFLLEAMAQLLPGQPRLRLLIVGDGPELEGLESLAAELGISSAVTFLGRRDDIVDLLAISDVYVLPSLIEGFPIALLEAMAAGMACVATDVGDVAEAVRHEETGMLVPPTDVDALAGSISSLGRDAEQRRRIGRAARDIVVERFSADEMVRRYCAIYDELIDGA